ncbi:MAG: flagellar hook-basal body complex protein [bacterium]|nr:flagellar hook-basal body complex protein [bacterium]
MSDVRITALNSITAIDGWLKALAGNLTGSTVTGFRQTRVQFEDVLARQVRGGSPAGVNGLQSINPIQYSEGGTAIKATRTDFSQGALAASQRPTDLAIRGNGFFVLSRVKNPTSVEDLVFTRNGSFTLEYEEDPTILDAAALGQLGPATVAGRLNLVSAEGYYVMGLSGTYEPPTATGQPGVSTPPQDKQVLSGLGGNISGALDQFKAFSFPIIKDSNGRLNLNADLVGRLQFNQNGLLLNAGTQDVPQSAALDPLTRKERDVPFSIVTSIDPVTGLTKLDLADIGNVNKYVALAVFANPEGLDRQAGTSFTWGPATGNFAVGVAGFDGQPIGATNEIAAGNLEAANSSVNTTLPELTIAQKSFTAQVKIVSVGNTLIDDVNQLIR